LKPDPRILVIDDEKASRRLLRIVLEPYGYRILEAENTRTGVRKAVGAKPDVIILEIALPNEDGLAVLQNLREWSQVPVLILSERTDDSAKVGALDAGASDYVTKPFSPAELLARLRVLLRPLPNVPDGPFLVEGELVANLATHQVTIAGRSVKLTRKEEVLFYVLARYAGRVVTCSHLLRSIWGMCSDKKIQDLRVLICQIRKKLGPYGGEVLLRTQGNLGYSLALAAKGELAVREADS